MNDVEPLELDEIVRTFLDIALVHPDKPPKTQRAERENTFTILGFNRAQEALRSILAHHGATAEIRDLAGVHNEHQQKPIDLGGRKVWVVG